MNKIYPTIQLAKTASALATSRKEVAELRARVVGLEKRAAAETFLLEMMESARAPMALKPSSIEDFLKKRAAIEQHDLEVAKLAAKIAGEGDFGIGDVEEETIPRPYNESRADAEFTDWLVNSQG